MAARLIAIGDMQDHPGYVAATWYIPVGIATVTSGAAVSNGLIRAFPGYVERTITLDTLGLRCTTSSAGGNVQAAIYANSASMKPTGNALVSTASMSTTSTGSLSSAASVQLTPGWYWWCTNCDNATAAFTQVSSGLASGAPYFGSATQNLCLNSGAAFAGKTVSQTFGTWPDLTSGSFTDVIGSTPLPVVQFKVASVP